MKLKIEKSKLLYYFLRGVVAYAFVILVFQGNWVDAFSTALIFILMTVPIFLKDKFKTHTPIEFDVTLSVFVFFTLYLGSYQNYYEKFPWFDGTLHFLSGILLGMIGFVLIYLLNQRGSRKFHLSPGFISFFAVTFSMAVSVVWEIFEYIGDAVLGYNMQESGIPDTMGDLIVNMLGALVVAIAGYFWMKKRKKVPFTDKVLG